MEKTVSKHLDVEFEETARIVHVSSRQQHHIATEADLESALGHLRWILDRYIDRGRVYLIIDMTNIIIEPELKSLYADLAHAIREKYVMPRGIARYGYQITRVTVRAGYTDHLRQDPHIFNSQEEAYAFIRALAAEQRSQEHPAAAR